MKTRKVKQNDWTKDYSKERDHKSYSDEPIKPTHAVASTASHTPTPWKARDYKNEQGHIWIDCDKFANHGKGKMLGGTIGEAYTEEDAAFIVCAVNSHEALINSSKVALDFIESAIGCGALDTMKLGPDTPGVVLKLKQIIAHAEGH